MIGVDPPLKNTVAGNARRLRRALRSFVCRRWNAEQLDGKGKDHLF